MKSGKHENQNKKTKPLHLVKFNDEIIQTTVTSKASEAQNWLQNIKEHYGGNRIIGIDCKFIRHPIRSMSNKIATLQLCIDTHCLILQLLHMDSIPQSVRDFLGHPHTTFVGVDIQENSQKLQNEYALTMSRKVDIHFLAKKWFPLSYKGRPSMRGLAYGIVGFSMRKCTRKRKIEGDWESRVLDKELVKQACVDAYASYSIAHKMLSDNSI